MHNARVVLMAGLETIPQNNCTDSQISKVSPPNAPQSASATQQQATVHSGRDVVRMWVDVGRLLEHVGSSRITTSTSRVSAQYNAMRYQTYPPSNRTEFHHLCFRGRIFRGEVGGELLVSVVKTATSRVRLSPIVDSLQPFPPSLA